MSLCHICDTKTGYSPLPCVTFVGVSQSLILLKQQRFCGFCLVVEGKKHPTTRSHLNKSPLQQKHPKNQTHLN
ncbi:Hypothetical predicted protein [Prunus dulcis]|uniref:Uncharacterized protein n=1 Tax=Prunus dulcis TaxID=3755 RepID=A0A5E4ECW3_PRUDU|nr:Hypothetical predicted protein [Prunus dulcis]